MGFKESAENAGRIFSSAALAFTLNACSPRPTDFPTTPQEIEIVNTTPQLVEASTIPEFNKKQLLAFYDQLQIEHGTKNERLEAIKKSISVVLGNQGNIGTGVRIADGVFITVAHNFTVNSAGRNLTTLPTDIAHLNTGKVSNARQVYMDLENEMAVVAAPTGGKVELVPYIVFNTSSLEVGMSIWMMGIVENNKTNKIDLRISPGHIIQKPGDISDPIQGLLYADGPAILPGMSGGPVVDSEGRIIGLVQGGAQQAVNGRVIRTINRIVPITGYQDVVDDRLLKSLPNY